MATYVLTVGGATKAFHGPAGLRITEQANGRNTLNLALFSADGSFRPAVRDEIILTEDVGAGAVRIFGGHVSDPLEAGLGGYGVVSIVTGLPAVDFNALADRRQVDGTIAAGTLKAALQWLLPYLTPYGVSLDAGQVTGPSVPEFRFDGLGLAAALTQVVSAAVGGWVWEIDYNKTLRAFLPSAAASAAPFNITAHDGHVIGDIQVGVADGTYANRVVVRWTSAATSAYAFFRVAAGNFVDGDTVTVGSTTYTFRNAPAGATEVQVGADAEASLTSLAAAIVVAAQCWAYYTLISAAPAIKIIATEAGAAGNTIALASSNAIGAFVGEGLVVTAVLTNGTDQALTNIAISENLPAQAAPTGIWEQTFSEPAILSADVAQATADGLLAKLIVLPLKRVVYTTASTGLHPGQKQSITEPDRNLSGWFTITDVTIASTVGNSVRRTVTAVGGTALPYRWQDDARQLFSGSGTGGAGGFLVLSPPAAVTILSSPFPLGGSRENGVVCGTTPTLALNFNRFKAAVNQTLTASVETRNVGGASAVRVFPGLYDITAATWQWGTDEANHAWGTVQEITVTVLAGHVYALGLKTDTAGTDGEGYVTGTFDP